MELNKLGFNDYFRAFFSEYEGNTETGTAMLPGRIFSEHRNFYGIYTETGELLGEISGKMRFSAKTREDYPAVGDFVAVSERPGNEATIHAILPRRNKFSRLAPRAGGSSKTEEQIIAANLDMVLIVTALENDFSLRRIERYLTLAYDNEIKPLIVLSKADLCQDLPAKIAEVESIAFGVDIVAVSSLNGYGISELKKYFLPAKTLAILGSSGVGKSTLINMAAGCDIRKVSEVRECDGKGRHTTTSRELITLPGGALIIDTPGMRELQLWDGSDGLSNLFEDIESIAAGCKFSDCTHVSEPGCAVLKALDEGVIDSGRFKSYNKMKREAAYAATQVDTRARLEEQKKWKNIAKLVRNFSKETRYKL